MPKAVKDNRGNLQPTEQPSEVIAVGSWVGRMGGCTNHESRYCFFLHHTQCCKKKFRNRDFAKRMLCFRCREKLFRLTTITIVDAPHRLAHPKKAML